MPIPILQTKLYAPPSRPDLIPRSRLIDKLNEGLHRKLTLLSAGAGFGKTTLTSEWIAACGRPTAWLSLDEGDNDLSRFLTYFVAALQTVTPNLGEHVLTLLQSPQPPAIDAILTLLLNEIETVQETFFLVLDDYHVLESSEIDEALAFLLEHLPSQMHLVITTREDPNLPLARYRVRGQLTEVRAADLRFAQNEATEFLNQVMELNLSAEEITALEARTEGWIAGLQMAALSMQERPDIAGFIQAFTGSHRFVLDYLIEEVLQQQSEDVRSFLLQTAILDQLSGPLCNAVTGREDSQEMLTVLERVNLFVVPLDDERKWYRYHHLFADVLQSRLMTEQPNTKEGELRHQVSTLHQRASEWYEHQGLPADAIHHALLAEDFDRAARLIELRWSDIRRHYHNIQVLGWLKALPDALIQVRPVLSVRYAWALLSSGKIEAVAPRLRDAERWLETQTEGRKPLGTTEGTLEGTELDAASIMNSEMVVDDEVEFQSLPASIASARAYQAQALGDVAGTVEHARRALDLLPEGDPTIRAIPATLLGLAYWSNGELEAAYQAFADVMAGFQVAGNLLDTISVGYVVADIRMAQGRLHAAHSIYEQLMQLAMSGTHVAERDKPSLQGVADLHVGMSELSYEWGDLESARQHLQTSKEFGEQAAFPNNTYRWPVAMAQIKVAQGDLDGALELLDEAERLRKRDPMPDVHPIAALKVRIWIKQGRLTEALGWTQEQALFADDELSYLREFEHITLARLLIALYSHDPNRNQQKKTEQATRSIHDATRLLERLLQAAQAGNRLRSVVEIHLLQALAYEVQGDIPAALVPLQQALTLAEPESYFQCFVAEGSPVKVLLREAAQQDTTPNYVTQLLEAFEKRKDVESKDVKVEDSNPVTQPLLDPLSDRELDVLRLLGTELSGPEIARELIISPNTMRTHTKNIYSKLDVHNRRAAVSRAQELGFL